VPQKSLQQQVLLQFRADSHLLEHHETAVHYLALPEVEGVGGVITVSGDVLAIFEFFLLFLGPHFLLRFLLLPPYEWDSSSGKNRGYYQL
jgi:hypothetical protein